MAYEGRKLALLIDSEIDFLDIARLVLESHLDMVAITERDGRAALRLLDVIEPDLIMLDMMIPSPDGFGFLREYTGRPGAAPVLATAVLAPYLEQALAQGAGAALLKPFAVAEFVAVARDLCARKRPAGAPPRPPQPGQSGPFRDEALRLQAILDLDLDVPAPEPELQRFIGQVASYFEAPVALFSVVTADRQYWTAACGMPADLAEVRGTPRHESFCTHAVASCAALVVQDTHENPFFRDNALVRTQGLRFYAGVPLTARHGEVLGTLCVMDYAPRPFTHHDLELLGLFGRRVLAAIEWREHAASPEKPQGAFRYLGYLDRELDIFGAAAFRDLAVVEAARGLGAGTPVACAVIAVPARRLRSVVGALQERHPRSLLGRLGHARLGWLAPGFTADGARSAAMELAGSHSFVETVELTAHMGAVTTLLHDTEMRLGDAGLR